MCTDRWVGENEKTTKWGAENGEMREGGRRNGDDRNRFLEIVVTKGS